MAGIKYWLWLSSQTNVSPGAKSALVEHYGGAEEAFLAPSGEFKAVKGLNLREAQILEQRDMSRVEEIIESCRRQDIDIITMQDASYPARLRSIYAPPVLLYVKGSIEGLDEEAAIAVIGTRRASPYGLKMGRNLAHEICRGGGTVISLLTEGIDEAAARGALLAGGRCIAVLGTPHPERESSLHRDICAQGAVISEYAPGTPFNKHFFRQRNRIASGLSVAVAVMEAPEGSGALLFAREALDQGREIFALPGNADAINSFGTNALLKQGARPVTCGKDILEEFEGLYPKKLRPERAETKAHSETSPADNTPLKQKKEPEAGKKEIDKEKGKGYIDLREQLAGLNEEQLNIISAIGKDKQHIDDIIEETGYAAAKVLANLTILEIKGYISRGAGKRISLNIKKK